MATTLSTQAVKLADGSYYTPVVRRFAMTNLTTGDTQTIVWDTHKYRVARGTFHAQEKAADSTFTFYLQTANTTDTGNNCRSSSGSHSEDHATTSVNERVYVGLGRYTRIRVANQAGGAGAAGPSTAVFFDLELI